MTARGWQTIPINASKNKYPGTCVACDSPVPAWEGFCWWNATTNRSDVSHRHPNLCRQVFRPAPYVEGLSFDTGIIRETRVINDPELYEISLNTKGKPNNMNLYEYAVVGYARDDNGDVQRNKASVLTSPTTMLAHDENEVRRTAVQALPAGTDLSDEALHVLVRPFVSARY